MKRSRRKLWRGGAGRLRRGMRAAALATALALASASSATADTDLGSAGGLGYRSDTSNSIGAPGFASVVARCPGSEHPTGGGAVPSGPTDEAWLLESRGSARQWFARFANTSGSSKTLAVYEICSDRKLKSNQTLAKVKPGKSKVVTADCPKGTHVSGGGGNVPAFPSGDEPNMVSSHPFDDGDANSAPDDGWKARYYNFSSTDTAFIRAGAQCLGRGQLDYVTSTTSAATCAAGAHVTGGGIKHAEADGAYAWVNGSSPFDSVGDADSVPDDGWLGLGRDGTRPKTVYAICL